MELVNALSGPSPEKNPKIPALVANTLGDLGKDAVASVHIVNGAPVIRLEIGAGLPDSLKDIAQTLEAAGQLARTGAGKILSTGVEAGWIAFLNNYFPNKSGDRRTTRDLTVTDLLTMREKFAALRSQSLPFGRLRVR